MVRVLERCEPRREVFRGRCYHCHSLLEEFGDQLTIERVEPDPNYAPSRIAHVTCPVCQHKATLVPHALNLRNES